MTEPKSGSSDLLTKLRQASLNVLEFFGPEYREESELYRQAADQIEKLQLRIEWFEGLVAPKEEK